MEFAQFCERNRLLYGVRTSELTNGESWVLFKMVKPWAEALHRSRIFWCPYPDRGEGKLANLPEVSGERDLSTYSTLMVTTELQELIRYAPYLYTQWKLEWRPGFSTEIVQFLDCAHIAHWCGTISRLHNPSVQSGDWHTVSGFWEYAQCNLEIAQIPRLHRTSISPNFLRWGFC